MNSEGQITELNPEEAITQIRTLQRTHHQEIKDLQTKLDEIKKEIDSQSSTTHKRMEDEFKKMKEEMKKFQEEAQAEQKEQAASITETLKELSRDIKGIQNSCNNKNNEQHLNSKIILLDDNNNSESSTQSETSDRQRNIPSPTLGIETPRLQMNLTEYNQQKVPMIAFSAPAPTPAPTFHGNLTERPWQFLIQVEDYAEANLRWNEETLLRGISQFLKDTAFEWYCQLRKYHGVPRTWNAFKEAFSAQFNSPVRKAQLKQQWRECKQRSKETINEFIVRLRTLWVEQYPSESEADLIKHLFCKMRPDLLNTMGCLRNASLSEILLEAERVEEILYDRAILDNEQNTQSNKANDYSDNTHKQNSNATYRKGTQMGNNNARYTNTRKAPTGSEAQHNLRDREQLTCYYCHGRNHIARDCWYYKEDQKKYSFEQPTTTTKNE